jgi:hypothetical protein
MKPSMAITSTQALQRYQTRHGLPPSVFGPTGDMRVLLDGGIRISLSPGPHSAVLLDAPIGAFPREPILYSNAVRNVGVFAAGLMVASPACCVIDTSGYGLRLRQLLQGDQSGADFDAAISLFASTCQTWREALPTLISQT